MDNDKLFEFMTKMYGDMQQGFGSLNGRLENVENELKDVKDDVKNLKSDVQKIGIKIDEDVTDKLKLLSDEQSMIRKEVSEINQGRLADRQVIHDIKLTLDSLHSNQRKQENKIIELDKKLAK